MPRARPALKLGAIPRLLLRIESSSISHEPRPKKQKKEDGLEKREMFIEIIDEFISEDGQDDVKPQVISNVASVEELKKEEENDKLMQLQRRLEFLGIYEEIYDVTLPSQIWGVHRDPEETCIAFSRLNMQLNEVDLLLVIQDSWNYVAKVGGSVVKTGTFESLSSDSISKLIEELDESLSIIEIQPE